MIDWKTVVFDGDWLQRLDRLAIRRFGEGGLAEEASAFVLEQLSSEDWAVLKVYEGRANPKTFLNTVSVNYLEEFSRRRFGRIRPPTWLKRQGELWTRIWRMVCLERQSVEAVIVKLSYNDMREPASIRSIINTIKGKLPWCGVSAREESTVESESLSNEVDISLIANPDQIMDQDLLIDMLNAMSTILNDEKMHTEKSIRANSSSISMSKWKQKLESFKSILNLDDEERLVIKMHYRDGIKLNKIAEALGLKSHLPGRILKRGLSKIEDALRQTRFQMTEIQDLAS